MQKIVEFITQSWNSDEIIIIYKKGKFRILVKDLNRDARDLIESSIFVSCNFKGFGYMNNGKLDVKTIQLERISSDAPVQLIAHDYVPTEYVTYQYDDETIQVQRNGFLVYCAPTGGGKTYFALKNLEQLSKQFDAMLYINLELSIDDIYNRIQNMGVAIPENLWVSPYEQVSLIEEWSVNQGKLLFIVDNIDNLVGSGDDPFGEQLEFIKKLDRFLKDNNHHALVLTQLVKDSNTNLLGKDGFINDSLNTNILSGVKQLSYLARSVMMTAYSPEKGYYVYKVLKRGSAIVNEI